LKKKNKKLNGKLNLKTVELNIDGMKCQSCEKIIEKEVNSINGVSEVKIDYTTGKGEVTYDAGKTKINKILGKINKRGYVSSLVGEKSIKEGKKGLKYITLTIGSLILLIGAYIILGELNFSLPVLDKNTSLFLIFVIGLLTGFHCVAMCGGFVVSYASKDAMHKRGLNLRSHILYGLSKTLSYTVIGAFFGLVGSFLTFTPFMRGVAAVFAGVFLIMFGFNMLDMFTWFRRFRLPTPNFIEKILQKRSGSSPIVTGLLNGLMIACGPLQAVYILAATSGSMYYGALYLLAFGLGTLPVLLSFGILTSFVSSQLTHRLLRFSGVVVIILGLIMLNRGLVLAGTPYDLKTVINPVINTVAVPTENSSNTVNLNPQGFQEIHMNVTAYGWSPDRFVLKKGVPVKWIIDGQKITNCNRAIQVPKLGLRFDIKPGLQTIEFTPNEAGTISWSCWMGMIPGVFIVKDDINVSNQNELQKTLDSVDVRSAESPGGSCGGSGGGCGCGGSKI